MINQRSGSHRIDRAAVDRLRAEIDAALPPLPRAKVLRPAVRSAEVTPKSPEHAEFMAAYDALKAAGFGLRKIAIGMGCSRRLVLDIYQGVRSARTEDNDWIERARSLLAIEEPLLPSGTEW